ncbi:DNA gyrase inhibitor YacG [Methylobacterium sp. A54F]
MSADAPAGRANKPLPPCPICGRPAQPDVRPFCSVRCSDIDLGRWLSDRYVIPGDDGDGEPLPDPER